MIKIPTKRFCEEPLVTIFQELSSRCYRFLLIGEWGAQGKGDNGVCPYAPTRVPRPTGSWTRALTPPSLGALSLEWFSKHWTPDSEGQLSLRGRETTGVPAAYCLQRVSGQGAGTPSRVWCAPQAEETQPRVWGDQGGWSCKTQYRRGVIQAEDPGPWQGGPQ